MVAILVNTEAPKFISVFEQVYTSANALLDKAHGDLGVVCETAGFPAEIQADLDSLNSYQPYDGLSGESFEKHPPAYSITVRGLKRRFYAISRTVFAGADHTGRTNPLAHHMLVPADVLSESVAPTDVLNSLARLFLSQWNDAPQRLEQPRDVPIVNSLGIGQEFPSAIWHSIMSVTHASEILGFCAEHFTLSSASPQIAIVFVIPPSLRDSVCDMLKDVLAVLPASFALDVSARTHVITPPSASGQSRVMFTYADTQFLAQSRRRQDANRPIIIDLVNGETSELPRQDYGRHIERVVSAGGTTSDLKALVSRRNQMGELCSSDGTPFSDFCTLYERLRSSEPFRNLQSTLTLMKNVANASESAQNVVSENMTSAILKHVNAQKSGSDWPALVKLAFDGRTPRKAQRLAVKAMEQLSSYALPHVFEHHRTEGKSGDKIITWLRTLAERPGAVTSLIRHAIATPNDRNMRCVKKTLLDLRPAVTPDEIEKWGRILQESEESVAQPLRTLIFKFTAQEIRARNLGPLSLQSAIPQIVSGCPERKRHEMLFELMEASAVSSQLSGFVGWVAETYGDHGRFMPGYDESRHSPSVLAAIRDLSTTDVGLSRHIPQPARDRHLSTNMSTPRSLNRRRSSRKSSGSKVEGLVNLCWWLFVGTAGLVLVSAVAFVYDWKSPWPPSLRIPRSKPSTYQWAGLSAYPLSVAVYALMRWNVKRNTGPDARVSTSMWYLRVALIAMVIGTGTTLYACFRWLYR